MKIRNRFVRVDLLVEPAIDDEYRRIIFSQGENASSDYRKYQKSVINKHKEQKELVKTNLNLHISPDEINENLDKWLIDARLRVEDGSIEQLKGVTKKSQHYTNAVNSYMFTCQKKVEDERRNKALLASTTANMRIRELEEENRRLKEEREQEQGTKHAYESRESKGRQQYATNYIYTCK